MLRNLLRKIKVLIAGRERKDNKYKEKQTGQSRLSIRRYNLSVILYTKYELSILYAEISCTKMWKEKRTYTRRNKQENAGSRSHDATSHCQFTYKILTFYLEQLLYYEKLQYWLHGKKERITKIRKNKQDKAGYLSHDTTCHCYSVYNLCTFYPIQLWRYL